jgi:hypothetical protein
MAVVPGVGAPDDGVGAIVGAFVGTWLGLGADVGDNVGVVVGTWLGLGAAVGAEVGEVVGVWLGVGAAVGAALLAAVGVDVADEGVEVAPPRPGTPPPFTPEHAHSSPVSARAPRSIPRIFMIFSFNET